MTSVDAGVDELVVELVDPLTVGSQTYTTERLALVSDTLILGGDAALTPIGRFQTGDVLFAFARQDQGDRFVASYVRIED